MPDVHRRAFLAGTAGLAAAGLLAPTMAEAGDPSFMNNVPDPLLAGKELPTFKFALEKSKGRVVGKSTAREATVEQLPISKGIAGVSHGARTGGRARAPLARHRGRVGVRGPGAGPDDGPRPAGARG